MPNPLNLPLHVRFYGKDIFKALMIRFGLLSGGIIHSRYGFSFYIRAKQSDFVVLTSMFVKQEYFKYFTIEKGDTVLDLGANIGGFSVIASVYKPEKIICVEADPETFNVLKKNLELNNVKAELINKAVWSEDNVWIPFRIMRNHSNSSTILERKGENYFVIEVPTISLKRLVKDYGPIDFLKCDIEGAEFEVFLNTPKKYLKKIDKIVLEYHNWSEKYSHRDLIELFEKLGKDIKLLDSNGELGLMYIQ